jgi:tetratricopeptide (TPR) repeat protein
MMADEDFMLTDEERRQRRRKRRRWLLVAIALLVLAVVGAVAAKPVRHFVKGWQARRHADRTFAFIEQEKWREARDEATAAYRLSPNEPQALRAVARLLSRVNQPSAFEFWKKLAAIEPLTRADVREEAKAALKTNDLTVADEAVQELLKNEREKPSAADWLLAADVAGRKHQYDKASQFAEKALGEPGLTRREEYQAVFILQTVVRDGGARFVRDAKQIDDRMASLARGNDDVALDALIVLAQFVAGAAPEANNPAPMPIDELIRRIDDHPLAKISHKLLAADLEIRHHSDQRAQIEEREIERWKNSDDKDLAVLAAWLSRHGQYQRALALIPTERAVKSRELFIQNLDTLGAIGRWAEVKQLLESDQFPLEPFMQKMYLARCNTQLGEKSAADNNWKRALESAAGDPAKLVALADYAEKNAIIEVAGLAYEEAAAEAPNLWVAQQGRLRIAQMSGDTQRIHAVLASMLSLRPNDPAVQNEEAYTRLLLLTSQQSQGETRKEKVENEKPEPITNKEEVEKIEALARKLLAAEPDSLPHRTLLGLVLLKQNRPQEAVALYNGLNVPQKELTPSTVVVHAAILAQNGREADARIEVSHLPKSKLLPEERALVSGL